jgi:hypothetical protein
VGSATGTQVDAESVRHLDTWQRRRVANHLSLSRYRDQREEDEQEVQASRPRGSDKA